MTDTTNPERKPFKDLPRDTQVAMFEAYLDGVPICSHGAHVYDPGWYPNVAYYTKPEPMWLDWSVIDDKFNYAAADEDGCVCVFDHRPYNEGHGWFEASMKGDSTRSIGGTLSSKAFKRGTIAWDESLIVRPGVTDG